MSNNINKKQAIITISLLTIVEVWIILFKLGIPSVLLEHMGRWRFISLGFENLNAMAIGDIFMNILVFIPVGIISSILFKNKVIKYIYPLIFTILLEALQYIFIIGGANLKDVLSNYLGGIIGILLFDYLLIKINNKALNIMVKISNIILLILSIYGISSVIYFFINYHQMIGI